MNCSKLFCLDPNFILKRKIIHFIFRLFLYTEDVCCDQLIYISIFSKQYVFKYKLINHHNFFHNSQFYV